MQLKHAVDQVLHGAALLREGGEVTEVPLAGRKVLGQVRRPHALVTGDDDFRVQSGDRVDAGDPGFSLRVVGLVHHHVHVVVDHITADNCVGRRHAEDRRTLNVTLANVDQVDDLTVHHDLVTVQHVGHNGHLGKLAGEARGPRSEEHTSELQSQSNLVCRLLLEKKKKNYHLTNSYKQKIKTPQLL